MKKIILTLALSILTAASLFAMNEEDQAPECCSNLTTIAYKTIAPICSLLTIRTDYLYLAHADCTWWLKKKLALQENFNDFDRYYARSQKQINQTVIRSFRTPLHEAIVQGNIGCISLLLAAGADKKKKIQYASNPKNEHNIHHEQIAGESYNLPIVCLTHLGDTAPAEVDKEIAEFRSNTYIGLSAVDLAQKLITDTDYVPAEMRQTIYDLLKKHD